MKLEKIDMAKRQNEDYLIKRKLNTMSRRIILLSYKKIICFIFL